MAPAALLQNVVSPDAGAFRAGKRVAAEAWNIGAVRRAVIRVYDGCLSKAPAIWRFVDQHQAAALRNLRRA